MRRAWYTACGTLLRGGIFLTDKTDIRRENGLLDIFKFIAALLIVGSHCLPFFGNDALDYYYGQWFFRFCVPLFLISTGYFFSRMDAARKRRYLLRILIVYAAACAAYWPLMRLYQQTDPVSYFLFGFSHLWYLPALLFAGALHLLTDRFLPRRAVTAVSCALFAFGVFFDEYYKMFDLPSLNAVADFVDEYLGQTRNGLFFAFPMMTSGALIAERDAPRKELSSHLIALAAAFALAFAESAFLRSRINGAISLDLSLFNRLPALVLMRLCLSTEVKLPAPVARGLRKGADLVYLTHYGVILILGFAAGLWGLSSFIATAVITTAAAAVYALIRARTLR